MSSSEPASPAGGEWPRSPESRALLFWLLVAWIVAGPVWVQVLGQSGGRWMRPWQMYRRVGLGVAEARFFAPQPDGSLAPLDRYALLGHGSRHGAPREVQVLAGRHGVWAMAQELCGRLGPDADVRAQARVGSLDGWRRAYDGSENLCRAPEPPAVTVTMFGASEQ